MIHGSYRRGLRIIAEDGRASAELEDDFHHFKVIIRHSAGIIEDVAVDSIRSPWTTCPAAAIALARLAGKPIILPIPFDDPGERSANCTHMLDLAHLALAHVDEPGLCREYRIEVAFPEPDIRHATLDRDGERRLDWRVRGDRIIGGRFDGDTPDALIRDIRVTADPQLLEAVTALRRALWIGRGRSVDLDTINTAADLGPTKASCHSFLPSIRGIAMRNRGTTRDFAEEGRWPLA